ncbi:MAG: glycosyltransferase family 4 protein [Phycisphaeraceae bacterium]|nr:glycosyltransferase family 4 protein [Phycisphaeraceae bacterium]
MKTLLLTPGTGNFHCGSCLHDEALVRGLRKLGHDAAINALYLPLVLDDAEGINGDQVSMGGIGMYLQVKSALFRWLPGATMRWLDRPSLLRKASNRADMTSPQELGRMTEQMLLGQHGKTRLEIDRLINHLRQEGAPDTVLLNNALLLGLAEPIFKAMGCPVVCTLQGEDTFIDSLPEPWRTRVWHLLSDKAKDVELFLPVSRYHADVMADRMGLSFERMQVVYNGIEAEHYKPQDTPPDPPVIGYFARLCENKGLGTLVDAFLRLHERGQLGQARLHLAGAASPKDMRYVDQQHQRLADAGLADRMLIETNVSLQDKAHLLRGMTVLSVPATYGESFGLYVLEANACGVPVVEPDHAGLAEVVALTGGGILCDPDDPASLADRLAQLLDDPARRDALGQAGRTAVLERFTAEHMAKNVANALETACLAPSA